MKEKLVGRFTANALTVLEKRYLLRDDQGALVETPEQLFERVASAIAEPEKKNDRSKSKSSTSKTIHLLMIISSMLLLLLLLLLSKLLSL